MFAGIFLSADENGAYGNLKPKILTKSHNPLSILTRQVDYSVGPVFIQCGQDRVILSQI